MSATNVLLHEQNLSYPSVESLPKPTGNWHIAKLVQYPQKTPQTTDSNGNRVAGEIIPGQFKCAEYSTFFQNTITIFGKVVQARTWRFGNNNTDETDYVQVPLDSFTEQELLDIIKTGNLYLYVKVEKVPGARPTIVDQATIEEYRAMTETPPPVVNVNGEQQQTATPTPINN